MNRKFCLIIGDGFTRDFVGKTFNTSKPFNHFNNNSVAVYYNFFISHVSDIHEEILSLISKNHLESEFDAIELFSRIHKDDIQKECKLRRYLALTYSALQRELDKMDKSNWRWYRWLNQHKDSLTFAISFNYDLLLETSLNKGNIKNYRTGSSEETIGVPIFKPHGSIDFDIQQPQFKNVMDQRMIAPHIWNMHMSLNQVNGVVQAIPRTHWLLPRLEADIIPPSQGNYQRHLDWVDKGFREFDKYASDLTDLIIIGHSYSASDRPEIDYFLEKLNQKAMIYISNPNTSIDLTDKLESLGLKYIAITDFTSLPW